MGEWSQTKPRRDSARALHRLLWYIWFRMDPFEITFSARLMSKKMLSRRRTDRDRKRMKKANCSALLYFKEEEREREREKINKTLPLVSAGLPIRKLCRIERCLLAQSNCLSNMNSAAASDFLSGIAGETLSSSSSFRLIFDFSRCDSFSLYWSTIGHHQNQIANLS